MGKTATMRNNADTRSLAATLFGARSDKSEFKLGTFETQVSNAILESLGYGESAKRVVVDLSGNEDGLMTVRATHQFLGAGFMLPVTIAPKTIKPINCATLLVDFAKTSLYKNWKLAEFDGLVVMNVSGLGTQGGLTVFNITDHQLQEPARRRTVVVADVLFNAKTCEMIRLMIGSTRSVVSHLADIGLVQRAQVL